MPKNIKKIIQISAAIAFLANAYLMSDLLQKSSFANGEIIEIKEEKRRRKNSSSSLRKTYYTPVAEYKINDESYIVRSMYSTKSNSKYKLGDEVKIIYNPNEPEQGIFFTFKHYIYHIVFILISIIVFVKAKQIENAFIKNEV